jgi:hypothetical protein
MVIAISHHNTAPLSAPLHPERQSPYLTWHRQLLLVSPDQLNAQARANPALTDCGEHAAAFPNRGGAAFCILPLPCLGRDWLSRDNLFNPWPRSSTRRHLARGTVFCSALQPQPNAFPVAADAEVDFGHLHSINRASSPTSWGADSSASQALNRKFRV